MRKVFANFVNELPKNKQNKIHKNILKIFNEESFNAYLANFSKEKILDSLLGKLNFVMQHFKNEEINETKIYQHLKSIVKEQSIETSR